MSVKNFIKASTLKFLLIILIIYLIYAFICVINTNNIVKKAERVLKGEEIITDASSPWYRMGLHKQYLPREKEAKGKVYHIFTWCGLNKGYIYIWYSIRYLDSEGNILHEKRDFCKLRIEKRDGIWEMYSFYIAP